jgi:hypothetical protein
MEPFSGWIYLCSTRKRRWLKTSTNNLELKVCKNNHPQSQQLSYFWLPQSVARDVQQEYQQPFSLSIECADGVSDVLVADDADSFSLLLNAINIRGSSFFSVPSGGYAHHRHSLMVQDSWNLCWSVIEDQFLTLWKNKSEHDAAVSSSGIGGLGGEVQPLLVLPLLCATVIQCTDAVTISIDLHQCGKVVATHYLHLMSAKACDLWMTGFLNAVGRARESTLDLSQLASATPPIATLNLVFPQQITKTPEPGVIGVELGGKVVSKEPVVLPDIVYGSAEQLAASAVPPLPESRQVAWSPLSADELSKLTAALGDPLQAIGARISASLSWLKGGALTEHSADAAAGVAGANIEASRLASAACVSDDAAVSAALEPLASTQRSESSSHSLQSVQSLRYRQPMSSGAHGDAGAVPASQQSELPPPAGGLMSSLPLPECSIPFCVPITRLFVARRP